MKRVLFGLSLFALALNASASFAQVNNGKVTTSPPTYANNAIAPFSLDTAGNTRVNCVSGCSGGSFNNNADGVATSSGNGQAAAWLYAFNGATWDRLRDDASKNLLVALGAAIPAGSAIIGKVGIDQTTPGTTNAVSATNFPATVDTNSGNKSASTIRVVVATDQPNLTTPLNENVAQINGVTPLMGNGVTGTGSQRVTVASDNTPFAIKIDQTTPGTTNAVQDAATSATGAAVPSKAQLAGARSGANIVELIQASASAALTGNTATTTQLVALSGSTKIYVTSFDFLSVGTANVKFVYGTGSNCGTGTTDLTGNYNLTAQSGVAKGSGLGPVLVVPAGNALCWTNSAAVQVSGSVSYTQF